MVSSAVFDAVNGIDRSYQSLFVKTRAPRLALSAPPPLRRHTRFIRLYPTQVTLLTDRRDASLRRSRLVPKRNALD